MDAIPDEFEALLTPRGRRLLAGRDPLAGKLALPRTRLVSDEGLIRPQAAERLRKALERGLAPHLVEMNQPIPPDATWAMTENYAELLPKTVRVQTAYLQRRREAGWRAAEELGLNRLLASESFGAFACALAGRPLQRKWGTQVLRYRPGDYAGPHNDHHPEEPEAATGYLDIHLTLASPDVAHQWLVWAESGHFGHIGSIATRGGITGYRLPFWHLTTPLVARPGREKQAHRWVLLGTFLFAGARSRTALRPPFVPELPPPG